MPAAGAMLGDPPFRQRLLEVQAAEIGRFELGVTVRRLRRRCQILAERREATG